MDIYVMHTFFVEHYYVVNQKLFCLLPAFAAKQNYILFINIVFVASRLLVQQNFFTLIPFNFGRLTSLQIFALCLTDHFFLGVFLCYNIISLCFLWCFSCTIFSNYMQLFHLLL